MIAGMTPAEQIEYSKWLDSLDNKELQALEAQAEASFQRQELPEDFKI